MNYKALLKAFIATSLIFAALATLASIEIKLAISGETIFKGSLLKFIEPFAIFFLLFFALYKHFEWGDKYE